MIYTIKRFSALEQKEFDNNGISKKPENIVGDVFMEGIKLSEMWRSFENNKRVGVHTKHWINRMADRIFEIGEYHDGKFQSFFIPLDENPRRIPSEFTNFHKLFTKGRTYLNVMKDEVESISKLTRKGELKYAKKIQEQGGTMPTKDQWYIFKFIALTLSGQCADDSPWERMNEWERMPVDYKRKGPRFAHFADLQKKLEEIFVEFFGPNDFIK